MKEKNLKWLSLILVLIVNIVALNVALAPPLPNVYMDPEESVYNPGEFFYVNIMIDNAVDVYSWGIKVRWDRDLLIATDVIEGDFLMYQPDGSAFVKKIYSNYVDAGCTTLGDWPGKSGDGMLMSIEFEVLDAGKTSLEIFYSVLLNSASPSVEIEHTVEDGYFETTVAANLVKKKAWMEHHDFYIAAELAKDGDSNQTLYSLVKNVGPAGYDLYVYVAFEIVRDDGVAGTLTSDVVTVSPGTTVPLNVDFGPLGNLDVGKHYVTATCWYSYTGTYWAPGDRTVPVINANKHAFSFAVFP